MKKFPIIGLVVGSAVAMYVMKKRKGSTYEEESELPSTQASAA
jgi:hypothetical protein